MSTHASRPEPGSAPDRSPEPTSPVRPPSAPPPGAGDGTPADTSDHSSAGTRQHTLTDFLTDPPTVAPAPTTAPAHTPRRAARRARARRAPLRLVVGTVAAALAGSVLFSTPVPTEAPDPLPTPAPAAAGPGPDPAAGPGPGPGPAAPTPAPGSPGAAAAPVYFAGRAFDTCEAPSLAVMDAWRGSPYGALGIYFGGRGRGCPVQRELNPSWVASVHAMGWRLLPLFVGSQAPCVNAVAKRPFALGSDPSGQGTREGAEAVQAARALGLDTSSPLYLDIEAYQQDDARCAATTLSFVRAWNREVRRLGYLPGFYSSADTGVRDIEAARRAGTPDMPAVMWFARWLGRPALATEPVLHPEAWTPHARIHQYAGNVAETYGGRRMLIDRNTMDAPVARVAPSALSVPGDAERAEAGDENRTEDGAEELPEDGAEDRPEDGLVDGPQNGVENGPRIGAPPARRP
ncbi:DUF1906 domain-containing protein [Streptomyces sp. NPDC127584]|uniref:DUF1906 domain-containing protein n=1 Tax=Streptomyces sp. NPDC127584 TaxID=3345403 RepID=UPI0036368D78